MKDILETVSNVGAGFVINLTLAFVIYGQWFDADYRETIEVTVIFTIAALIRSFAVRKLFRRLGDKKVN